MDLLAVEFGELKAEGFDLNLTGFDPYEWQTGGVTPGWEGMPEFEQADLLKGTKPCTVYFATNEARRDFAELVGEAFTDKTGHIWYPRAVQPPKLIEVPVARPTNPRYPVYIVSKGRWETRLTSKALESLGVPYRIVIEPQVVNYKPFKNNQFIPKPGFEAPTEANNYGMELQYLDQEALNASR
jgi:hypothetical protein